MSAVPLLSRLLKPAERLTAALRDPFARERNMTFVLIAYALVWAIYGAFAKGSQDVHFDMGEVVAWARALDFGYTKHPPLAAWTAAGWFAIFPLTDWSFYLFAMVLSAVSLGFAWRVAGDYLEPDKRIAGVALLSLVPFFHVHALKFNANTITMPVWAATTFFFLRSLETRAASYAVAAGVAAGLAMLAKYWSVLLLAGLVIAALSDSRRAAYFRSRAPWLTILAGALTLSPHLWWLVRSGFESVGYATISHPVESYGEAFVSGLGYVAGALGYALPAVLPAALMTRPSAAALADVAWPQEQRRRTALIAFVTPILLPILAAVGAKSDVVSIWAMASMTLLPVVLLSSPKLVLPERAVVHAVAAAMAFPLVMMFASPLIGAIIHQRGVPKSQDHYQLLAREIDTAWRATTAEPLRYIGGDPVLAFGTVFYLADRPRTFTAFDTVGPSALDPAAVREQGLALTCVVGDRDCAKIVAPYRDDPRTIRREVTVSRSHFGMAGKSTNYEIFIVPPR